MYGQDTSDDSDQRNEKPIESLTSSVAHAIYDTPTSNVGEDGSGSCVEESWMPVEDVVGGAVRPDEEETKLQEGGQHRPHRFVG